MREQAMAAVFDAILQENEIAAAVRAQRLERAITEQTIEITRIVRLMAGEEFTLLILKISIMPFHDFGPPKTSKKRSSENIKKAVPR